MKTINCKFSIEGYIPSKKNTQSIYYRGKSKRPFITPNQRYKTWHAKQLWLLKQQAIEQGITKPIDCELSACMLFVGWDRRRWDTINKEESVDDILVDAGIIKDDNYKILRSVFRDYKFPIKNHPGGVFITLTNYENQCDLIL